MGVETSVSKYVARCQEVLEHSGLTYHAHGTGIEGEFSDVAKAIEACHEAVHAMGCPRIASDIRIGTRTDKKGSLEAKVSSVQALLSKSSGASTSDQPSRTAPPSSISLPTPVPDRPDPAKELARRVSETQQFLMSPNYDPPAGRDA
ncbi:Ecm15p [Rhodotorula paludigena]|uniref:Ecm15p n=1 Tax=Rhodotorula paludigena TaxID=86838 RepID=UPI00318051D7